MGTYDDLRKRALSDPELRAEYERLNREEFAALDAMLAARRAAGVASTDIVEGPETSAPTVEEHRLAFVANRRVPSLDTLLKRASADDKRFVTSLA